MLSLENGQHRIIALHQPECLAHSIPNQASIHSLALIFNPVRLFLQSCVDPGAAEHMPRPQLFETSLNVMAAARC